MMTGSASAIAAIARYLSPALIASSTFRTALRKRERRVRLTAVRRTLCRAAFLADFVLAMIWERELRSGAYRGAVALRQRLRLPSGPGSRVLPSVRP